MKTEECLNARKETYIKNYGCDNPSKSDKIKLKKEETCLKNFGVNSPLQNVDVFKRNKISAFKHHFYKNYTYQGTYELDFIIKYEYLLTIENPDFKIDYFYENKNHKYHPDFFIRKYNLIVEIKSDYTYYKEIYKNDTKQQACLDNGYNFIFIINKDYSEFNRLLMLD